MKTPKDLQRENMPELQKELDVYINPYIAGKVIPLSELRVLHLKGKKK